MHSMVNVSHTTQNTLYNIVSPPAPNMSGTDIQYYCVLLEINDMHSQEMCICMESCIYRQIFYHLTSLCNSLTYSSVSCA